MSASIHWAFYAAALERLKLLRFACAGRQSESIGVFRQRREAISTRFVLTTLHEISQVAIRLTVGREEGSLMK